MNDQRAATLIELHTRILTLKLLPRTGWLQRGIADAESIAEHTFGVASLALMVGDQLPEIDRGRLLAIALLHDMAEILIGDLPASARRFLGAAAKREAERQALIELFRGLPQEKEYLELWAEYADGRSREARLVKALDRLEMLAQALAYERAGSRSMAEFWEEDSAWSEEFPLVQSMADRLHAAHTGLSPASHNGMSVAH